MALVIDEYGVFQGIITYNDITEAIVGDMPGEIKTGDPDILQTGEGSFLLDGMIPIDDFTDLFKLSMSIQRKDWHCATLGGFVMMALGHIPGKGDTFEWGGCGLKSGKCRDAVLIKCRSISSVYMDDFQITGIRRKHFY